MLTAKAKVSPKETEWCFIFFDVHLLTQYQADGCAFVISVCLFHYHLLSEEASCSPLYLYVLGISGYARALLHYGNLSGARFLFASRGD